MSTSTKHQPSKVHLRRIVLASLTAAVLGISACASTPPLPTHKITEAETAIQRAEESRVAEYAPVELRAAREKLTAAREMMQQAVADKDKEAATRAAWLAEESVSDAELATAKADEARAKEVNEEMENTVDVLQHELQRDH